MVTRGDLDAAPLPQIDPSELHNQFSLAHLVSASNRVIVDVCTKGDPYAAPLPEIDPSELQFTNYHNQFSLARLVPASNQSLMEEILSNFSMEEDVIEEILVKFPVKTLMRMKCVCKSWCSLIASQSFAEKHLNHHSANKSNKQIMIFRTVEKDIVSLHSHESLNFVAPPLPISKKPMVVGLISTPCSGLICYKSANDEIMMCNPSTREFKLLPPSHFPQLDGYKYRCHAIGFGIHNKDYKVISIASYLPESHVRNQDRLFKARIYSTVSNTWRSTSHDPTPVYIRGIVPTVNGRCHWISYHPEKLFILSFDMHDEMFLYIDRGAAVDIWVMQEYGVVKSWTKKFTIRYAFDSCGNPLLLWKNEILLMASIGKDSKVRLAWSYGDQRFEIDGGRSGRFQAMHYEESLISLKGRLNL
ncbi:F-box family protein [Striga asiatica]|uniref:F-box family protein n=1 Tax=Striga asiatica TaxID=4170 RepID=A0A5A7QBH0_STRAF|nr:F-box family protein [Striga asiatica]